MVGGVSGGSIKWIGIWNFNIGIFIIRGKKLTADSFQQTAVLSILLEFKNQQSNIVDRYPRALLELAKQSNPCIRGKKLTADSFQQTAVLSIQLNFGIWNFNIGIFIIRGKKLTADS